MGKARPFLVTLGAIAVAATLPGGLVVVFLAWYIRRRERARNAKA